MHYMIKNVALSIRGLNNICQCSQAVCWSAIAHPQLRFS